MSLDSVSSFAELIRKCKAGDKKAWKKLIDLISPVIFSICAKMRLSREESFDVFGQVCYLLLKNITRLRSADRVLAYVGTMTQREVYSLHRKSRVFEYLENLSVDSSQKAGGDAPDKMLEDADRSEMLMKAMLLLPERDYQLLRMLFFDQSEPGYEEISKRLGMPVSSIGPTRARSLAKLHRILKTKRFKF
jgi:RNA polymerase sigma factor (sigma-70 family)